MEEDIEFEESDRFFGGTFYKYADGTIDLQAPTYKVPENFKFTLHKVVQGQTLDRIAFANYGKLVEKASRYWWLIAEVNGIDRPWDLSDWVGKDLIIPDIFQYQVNR